MLLKLYNDYIFLFVACRTGNKEPGKVKRNPLSQKRDVKLKK